MSEFTDLRVKKLGFKFWLVFSFINSEDLEMRELASISRSLCSSDPPWMLKFWKRLSYFMAFQSQQFIFNIRLSILWPLPSDIWSTLEHSSTVLAPFYLKSKFHRTSLIAYLYLRANKVKFRLKISDPKPGRDWITWYFLPQEMSVDQIMPPGYQLRTWGITWPHCWFGLGPYLIGPGQWGLVLLVPQLIRIESSEEICGCWL